jgi:laccase
MPAGQLSWPLLLGAVLAFGVAASPAQASRNTHYDFVVSRDLYIAL